mgnify:CR=1 FL=1
MKYLKVKNFSEYQHYKNRTPPWVKLYYDMLSDFELSRLTIEDRYLFVASILLASRTGNRIPHDVEWIAEEIHWPGTPNYGSLINTGFIEEFKDDSRASRLLEPSARPRREEKNKRREEERREDGAPPKRARRLPETWQPSSKSREVGHTQGFSDTEIDRLADTFRDHAAASGRIQKDWHRSFNSWLRSGISHRDVKSWRQSGGGGRDDPGVADAAADWARRHTG